jgi:hypothetical protein
MQIPVKFMCFKQTISPDLRPFISINMNLEGITINTNKIQVFASNDFDDLVPTFLVKNGASATTAVLGTPLGMTFTWDTISAYCT